MKQQNEQLNALLIALSRSLLQYAGYCELWTTEENHQASATLSEVVSGQRENIGYLVSLLESRRWRIDWGTFNTLFTDLHFLSLQFLLPQIIADQQTVVEIAEQTEADLTDDAEALPLVEKIAADVKCDVEKLKQLGASLTAEQPAAK